MNDKIDSSDSCIFTIDFTACKFQKSNLKFMLKINDEMAIMIYALEHVLFNADFI